MARTGFFFSAERCAWRNGCGETAAKMGRGKVRAGGGRVSVAIEKVSVVKAQKRTSNVLRSVLYKSNVDVGKFWSSGHDALSLSLFVWGGRDHLTHKWIGNLVT